MLDYMNRTTIYSWTGAARRAACAKGVIAAPTRAPKERPAALDAEAARSRPPRAGRRRAAARLRESALRAHVRAGDREREDFEAARLCAINLLAQMKDAAGGDLDNVVRVIKLNAFVQAGPEFYNIPQVVNGCSDLMVAALGDAGKHARSAVGMYKIPLGFAVEIDAFIEVADRR